MELLKESCPSVLITLTRAHRICLRYVTLDQVEQERRRVLVGHTQKRS